MNIRIVCFSFVCSALCWGVFGCHERSISGTLVDTRVEMNTNDFFVISNNLKYTIVQVKTYDSMPMRFREMAVTDLSHLTESQFSDWAVAASGVHEVTMGGEKVLIMPHGQGRSSASLWYGIKNTSVAVAPVSEIEAINVSALVFKDRKREDREFENALTRQIVK